jgi:hypothetical protein
MSLPSSSTFDDDDLTGWSSYASLVAVLADIEAAVVVEFPVAAAVVGGLELYLLLYNANKQRVINNILYIACVKNILPAR